jgi:hypothetical protein
MDNMFPQVSNGGEAPPFRMLACVVPELWASALPGETWLERRARRDAAVDMLLDELTGGAIDAAA